MLATSATSPKTPRPLPISMRAVTRRRYGSASSLVLETLPLPTPGAGQVLVEVEAAGVDRGAWHLMTGRPWLVRAFFGLLRPKQPVLGMEAAGRIVALGPEVERLRMGDRVCGPVEGAFAEFAVAEADKLSPLPLDLAPVEGAVLAISGTTAMEAVADAAEVRAGQRVLVVGAAGGVGHLAVQVAQALGAEVDGVAGPKAQAFVESLGAARTFDYTRYEVGADPTTYHAIFDCGGRNPIGRLRRALDPEGTLVLIGGEGGNPLTGGFERQVLAPLLARRSRQRIVPLISREHHSILDGLLPLVASGAVRPRVAESFALERTPEAVQRLERGGVQGKLGVLVRSNP